MSESDKKLDSILLTCSLIAIIIGLVLVFNEAFIQAYETFFKQ